TTTGDERDGLRSDASLYTVSIDGAEPRLLTDEAMPQARPAWRPDPAHAPPPLPTPAPSATGLDELATRASRSPFPGAEVLHVMQIAEQQGPDGETHMFDTWVDQTSGDVVVWQTTMDGEPRSLTIRQGSTVIRAHADSEGWLSLNVTTTPSVDDPDLPNPLAHLDVFRHTLAQGADELLAQGVEVDQNASYDGQPAVEMTVPILDARQVVATVITAYLDPLTLYPVAIIDGDAQERFTYPSVEPLAHADVPAGTFEPDIPEARYFSARERIAPEAAARFDAYPLWWLAEEFSGYDLHTIDRYRSSTRDNDTAALDSVHVVYLAGPRNAIEIYSEPPLSDVEWTRQHAIHNAEGFEEVQINGNRAWLHPSGSQIAIEFPDSYVTIGTPRDLARPAAEALQQANAPVDLSEAAVAAAIAALPEDERGCGATPFAPPVQSSSRDEARGKTVIGDAELWMQYFTLNDDSPKLIRAGSSIQSYWVMDGPPESALTVRFDNLATGASVEPEWGPVVGSGWRTSPWRVIVAFPEPGCWQATITRGDSAAVIWLDVQPSLEELSTPVATADDFTAALTSLQPGEARRVTLSVTTAYRLDEGALNAWTVTIWDRVLPDGREQRYMAAYDAEGNRVAWFVRDGAFWQSWQRGWHETGSIAAGIVMLPEELRLADERVQLLGGLLDGSADGRAMGGREEGETTVIYYWFPGLVEMAERLNLRVDAIAHDVWQTTSSRIPFRAQTGV
ncbi:MAG TPA: hypothetical protein VMM78_18705, partial [Thermomicrobiales bacterium]|nr:hypothetical protein [Thermomicrobiales bacterium]